MQKVQITKRQLENPCEGCAHEGVPSWCCQVIWFDVPKFEDSQNIDFDSMHLYLTRKDIHLVMNLREGKPSSLAEDWSVELHQRCRYLQDDNRCGNYEKRPMICSDFQAFPTNEESGLEDNESLFCPRYDPVKEEVVTFTDPDRFMEYVKDNFGYVPVRNVYTLDHSKIEIVE